MFGTFGTETVGKNVSIDLVAVDRGGQEDILEAYTFRVELSRKFSVKADWLQAGGLYGGDYGAEGAEAPLTYYKGFTYDFPPINATEWPADQLFANHQGKGEKIAFSMVFCHRDEQGGACRYDQSAALDGLDVLVGKDGKASATNTHTRLPPMSQKLWRVFIFTRSLGTGPSST